MQIRINNIECRLTNDRYEIIKWRPNPYYNELHAYLLDGWHEEEALGFVCRNNTSIQRDIFDRKETCFVIADLVINHREPCVNLHTVGSRVLDLSKEERNDFFKVYELSTQMIGEKLFGVDDKEEF